MADKPEVKVGQVWRDRDKRMNGRHVHVTLTDGNENRAVAITCTPDGDRTFGRAIKLSYKYLQTRFDLVKSV